MSGFNKKPYQFNGRSRYVKKYSTPRLAHLFDDGVADLLANVDLVPEEEPRSVYRPNKLYDALDKYIDIHDRPLKRDHHYIQGVKFAWRAFAKPSHEPYLKRMGLDYHLINSLSNEKASAGITAFGLNKVEAFPIGIKRAKAIAIGDRSPEPCLAMARTQKNNKTRLVWCYPLSMNLIESIFAKPFIERFKTFRSPMHFGVAQRVTSSNMRKLSYDFKYAYSLDYSQFDASISREMVFEAFRIIQTWFDPNEGREPWPWEIDDNYLWKIIVNYFVTSPIVMPDGNLYYGRRNGVPSGSYFTQIIDSIVNVMLVGMINSRFRLGIKLGDFMVLGDDCVIFSNKEFNLTSISRFLRNRKVTLNPEKCEVDPSNNVKFLGRTWVNGTPTGEIQELVNKVCQPETFRRYGHDSKLVEQQLVLKSYASTYHNFQPYYIECLPVLWQKNVQSVDRISANIVDYRHLSGLMRYNMKYFGEHKTSTGILATVWK